MIEDTDIQSPTDSPTRLPASAGSVVFGDMWIAPSGALAFCWTVTWVEHRQVIVAEAVTFNNGKWDGVTSCDATWALRKRTKQKIPDPQGLKQAICRAMCAEIDRPIEYAAWKHGAPKGWAPGIPQNAENQATASAKPDSCDR